MPQSKAKYYCTEKRKGKLYAIAVWELPYGDSSCLALAEYLFRHYGHKERVERGDIEQFKNWGGINPGAPVYTDTDRQACQYAEISRAKQYRRMGSTWENYRISQEPDCVTKEMYEGFEA